VKVGHNYGYYKYQLKYQHSLWNILIEELDYCKNFLTNHKYYNKDWSNVMSQHSACLGLLRGVNSSSSQSYDSVPGDPVLSHIAPMASSNFSSPFQRQVSTELKKSLSTYVPPAPLNPPQFHLQSPQFPLNPPPQPPLNYFQQTQDEFDYSPNSYYELPPLSTMINLQPSGSYHNVHYLLSSSSLLSKNNN
jgi:hypothetical protein